MNFNQLLFLILSINAITWTTEQVKAGEPGHSTTKVRQPNVLERIFSYDQGRTFEQYRDHVVKGPAGAQPLSGNSSFSPDKQTAELDSYDQDGDPRFNEGPVTGVPDGEGQSVQMFSFLKLNIFSLVERARSLLPKAPDFPELRDATAAKVSSWANAVGTWANNATIIALSNGLDVSRAVSDFFNRILPDTISQVKISSPTLPESVKTRLDALSKSVVDQWNKATSGADQRNVSGESTPVEDFRPETRAKEDPVKQVRDRQLDFQKKYDSLQEQLKKISQDPLKYRRIQRKMAYYKQLIGDAQINIDFLNRSPRRLDLKL